MHGLATVGIVVTAELPVAAAMAHQRKNGREKAQPRERGGTGLTRHRREEKKLPSRGEEVAVAVLRGYAVFAILGDPRAEGARAGVEDSAAVAAVRATANCAAIVP
ncbi:uncharacterized protein DS421_10g302980 [Arachis hypogaea]|nr:uncharacterized protein DS421_10g302980 [Arachis hypogaea]